MPDYQPGCATDLRPQAMGTREARSTIGDFEAAAARVVARLTGQPVFIQDDNSKASMPDIRIDYKRAAACRRLRGVEATGEAIAQLPLAVVVDPRAEQTTALEYRTEGSSTAGQFSSLGTA